MCLVQQKIVANLHVLVQRGPELYTVVRSSVGICVQIAVCRYELFSGV